MKIKNNGYSETIPAEGHYCHRRPDFKTDHLHGRSNSTWKVTLPNDLWATILIKTFCRMDKMSRITMLTSDNTRPPSNNVKTYQPKQPEYQTGTRSVLQKFLQTERDIYMLLSNVCNIWRKTVRGPWFTRYLRQLMEPRLQLYSIKMDNLMQIKLDARRIVVGLAELQGRLYILSVFSKSIAVYDSETFTHLADVMMEEGKRLSDVASSHVSQCLYIVDEGSGCVWRLTAQGHHVTCFLSDIHFQSLHLKISVTSLGHVLLVCDVASRPTLYVYAPSSELVRTVVLPREITQPLHAVETPSGNYIVSHGLTHGSQHRVCEVTRDGHMVRSFGGQQGGGDGQLLWPVHVAIDAEGCVYVADWGNGRVLVLDSTLSLSRVLSTGDGARGLCYSRDTRRLVVGQIVVSRSPIDLGSQCNRHISIDIYRMCSRVQKRVNGENPDRVPMRLL